MSNITNKPKAKRSLIHVVHRKKDGQWIVKFVRVVDPSVAKPAGGESPWATKRGAIKSAIFWAKQHQPSSLRIHRRDGTIQEERTYPRSSDPRKTKG